MTAKTAPKVTLWEFFQQLGKTFMLPVALLSFCGIMLGIGSSLSSHDVITLIPVLGNPVLQAIFTWMSKIGSFAFSFLPVMFCIAIPLGLARENKGVAAFAGFVGYAVMNLAVNFWLTNKGILPTTDAGVLKANNIQSILGIQSIDTGILGAVIAGIIVWMLHERFHNIRLPDALAFFGGTRFVPIISSLVMGLVGLVIPLVWPIFAMGISGLGHMINSAGDFGPMLFGTGERLLLPFGLHHILVALIRFTDAGGTQEVCGQTVSGALTIFQAQLSCPTTHGFSESATRFLSQGKMNAAFPELNWQIPQSTYLAWLDLRPLNIDDNALQKVLIEQEKIAIMPGYTYGEEGRGFIRLNAGCPRSKLEKGVAGLINAIRAVG